MCRRNMKIILTISHHDSPSEKGAWDFLIEGCVIRGRAGVRGGGGNGVGFEIGQLKHLGEKN